MIEFFTFTWAGMTLLKWSLYLVGPFLEACGIEEIAQDKDQPTPFRRRTHKSFLL